MSNQIVILGHSFRRESESESNRKGKTFGNRNYDDRDGDNEDLKEGLAFDLWRVVILREANEKFDENHNKE
jgi:hypothetical protein